MQSFRLFLKGIAFRNCMICVADKGYLPPSATGICNTAIVCLTMNYNDIVAVLQMFAHFSTL